MKYRYQLSIYQHFLKYWLNIDTYCENIDINKISKGIFLKVSISIKILIKKFFKYRYWHGHSWKYWYRYQYGLLKVLISTSILIREFCKISISVNNRVNWNLAYRAGLIRQAGHVSKFHKYTPFCSVCCAFFLVRHGRTSKILRFKDVDMLTRRSLLYGR